MYRFCLSCVHHFCYLHCCPATFKALLIHTKHLVNKPQDPTYLKFDLMEVQEGSQGITKVMTIQPFHGVQPIS